MKLLSVIIVTYNSQHLIEKCLDNLFLHNDINNALEVIIVDNSKNENSINMFTFIASKYHSKVILIKNDRNGGYGQGNNIGIKAAKGKYIAIMNPDITMTEPLFNDAISKFENNQNLSIIGYKQMGAYDLSFFIRPEYFFPLLGSILTKFSNKINFFDKNHMFLSGAFFFARKQCFEIIGFFDENLFLNCEEPDITLRVLALKKDILFEKRKKYIHEIEGRKIMSETSFRFLLESFLYYLDKYSFNKKIFLKKMLFELKIKKIIFNILGKKDFEKKLESHINEIVKIKNY